MKAYYLSLVKTDTGEVGGGGVYFGFQVTGMMGGFCGFESFDSGIFWGRRIWQVFLLGGLICSRDFFGYSKQSEGS